VQRIVMKPRILLISQWPDAKNGEYELIERIKRTGFKVAVVDYLGVDVSTGANLNRATLAEDYDFAISFHYETPCLLNIPTYFWVANPLEFMYMRHDYSTTVLHDLRAYHDYLYNGSEFLKSHIARVVGSDWADSGLEMFPACAAADLLAPVAAAQRERSGRIFYCGVNWERASDKVGRAQGLLDELQRRGIADFYGPLKVGTVSTWEGFASYRGEIPFDGASMSATMRLYGAVLAVSSPAHIRSRTSSSRAFEATAAGAPVISDRNPHVEQMFGDCVYYFDGETSAEKAESIAARLKEILADPGEAARRVAQAQQRMAERFCFEPCYAKVLASLRAERIPAPGAESVAIDVFLFHHDTDPEGEGADAGFGNAAHVAYALRCAVKQRGARARVFCCAAAVPPDLEALAEFGVKVARLDPGDVGLQDWDSARLGVKAARLARKADADLTVFFSQFDHPHHDHFTRAIDARDAGDGRFLRIAGFYASGLDYDERPLPEAILRVNRPDSMYRWSGSSFAEHDLGALTFGRGALALLQEEQFAAFDAIFACVLVALAKVRGVRIVRARHISLRVRFNNFQRHFAAWRKLSARGLWSQHYHQVNFTHEINAFYDLMLESREGIDIVAAVSGRIDADVMAIDQAELKMVAKFIRRLQDFLRGYHTLRKKLGLKRK
jgi:hypothetical protein